MDGLIPTTPRGYANLAFAIVGIVSIVVLVISWPRYTVTSRVVSSIYGKPMRLFFVWEGFGIALFAQPVSIHRSQEDADAWIAEAEKMRS